MFPNYILLIQKLKDMPTIDDLLLKQNNPEQIERTRFIPDKQKLTAEEWNALCQMVRENSASVKTILFNGRTFSPDELGKVTINENNPYRIIVDTTQIAAIPQNVSDTNVVVGIKARSIKVDDYGETELLESLVLKLETLVKGTQNTWRTYEFRFNANSSDWYMLDLSPYLVSGDNTIRFQVIGDNSMSDKIGRTINVVNLTLQSNNDFSNAFTGNILNLQYLVGGDINKHAIFDFGYTDDRGRWNSVYTETKEIGTDTFMSLPGKTFTFTDPLVMTNGLHTVRVKLESIPAAQNEGILETDTIESQYMVIQPNTQVSPMVIINNIHNEVDNNTEVALFDYAAYTAGSDSISVYFVIRDILTSQVLAVYEREVESFNTDTLRVELNLELDPSVTNLQTEILTLDGDDPSTATALAQPTYILIHNYSNLSFSNGADFVLSPASRSNNTGQKIINVVTGEEVTSHWENFDMITDGYVPVPKYVDGTISSDKLGALHIPAGRKIRLEYNPLDAFINSQEADSGPNSLVNKSVTLEIDFRTYNILDEDEPVINLSTQRTVGENTDIWGLEIKAMEACLMTKGKRLRMNQNVFWAEEKRTRLTINIVYGLNPDNDPLLGRLNYVRMFIDDTIEREFTYEANDRFLEDDLQLVLGADNVDLDIFGIRCYKTGLSIKDVMQDYVAGLSTISEKNEWKRKNDILGSDGNIDFDKAVAAGYNVILHTGTLPKYGMADKGKCFVDSLLIHINGDEKRSGTLYNLDGQGQGNTAMTYYDWNQQYKVRKGKSDGTNTRWEQEYLEPGETPLNFGTSGYQIQNGESKNTKMVGKINFASSMQGHKMGATIMFDEIFKDLIGRGQMSQPGQMMDGNHPEGENPRIAVYAKPFLFFHRATPTEENPNPTKVFKYLMTFGSAKGDKGEYGYNNKTQQMFWVEGTDNTVPLALFCIPWNEDITYDTSEEQRESWMYNGAKQITFRLGVVDEVTINGVKTELPRDTEPGFAGIDYDQLYDIENNRVVDFSSIRSVNASAGTVTLDDYSTVKCDYEINRVSNYLNRVKYEIIGGKLANEDNIEELNLDAPVKRKIGGIKPFFNFAYLHNTTIIRFYDGTLSQLNNGEARAQSDTEGELEAPQTLNRVYWLSSGANKYRMYRYDYPNRTWIDAGVNKEPIKLNDLCQTYYDEIQTRKVVNSNNNLTNPSSWPSEGYLSNKNRYAKEIMERHFVENAGDYFHVDDALYHSCFIKLVAGTDNRAKNTFYYVDPVTLKLRWMQDDLDTIIKTNNLGQQRKPYYVEEHDSYDGPDAQAYIEATGTSFYWQGENNGFYNIVETAFATDMSSKMYQIFSSMRSLSRGREAFDYFIDRILYAQNYFPATAYNEFTRLVYERASIAQSANNIGYPTYTNTNADALSQSNGTQRWSEYQWIKDRMIYLSSWCEYGEFVPGTGASTDLSFRATTGNYSFTLTPAKWLYPRIAIGSSNFPSGINRVRVPAKEQRIFNIGENIGDTTISIHGIHYFYDIGDMNIPVDRMQQQSFTFHGKRLQRIVINPNGTDANAFVTGLIIVGDDCRNIKEFVVRGVTTLTTATDLSGCTKIEKIDMRGSTTSSIKLPDGASLKQVYYPATIDSLVIKDKPQLVTVVFEGVSNLETVDVQRVRNEIAEQVIAILENL